MIRASLVGPQEFELSGLRCSRLFYQQTENIRGRQNSGKELRQRLQAYASKLKTFLFLICINVHPMRLEVYLQCLKIFNCDHRVEN